MLFCGSESWTAITALEQVVSDLEQGQLGLGESLARYEQGVKHLKQCYQLLENAEKKIAYLRGVDADGNPVTEPYEDEGGDSLIDKSEARGRRRSKTPTQQDAAPANQEGEADVDLQGGLF